MKLGNYYVPDILVSQAIEIVKIIYKDNVTSEEGIATKLNHKTTNSGGFIKKLVTLRQLGLIKSGIKALELTSLGTKIARPVGDELKQSYKELLSHLPLFLELRKKLIGKTLNKEGLLVALIDVTGLERATLDRELSRIQNIYNDIEKYTPATSESLISDEGGINMENLRAENQTNILEIRFGSLYMRLPKDLEAIEQAEMMLKAQKDSITKKQNKKE